MIRMLCTLMAFVVPLNVFAQSVIYRWVDDKGVVHITDDLNRVPEPYASLYRARIRELEEKRAAEVGDRKTPLPTVAPPRRVQPTESLADRELARRKHWIARVKKWRTELEQSTLELEKLDRRIGEVSLNPLLRTTPQAKKQAADLKEKRKAAFARVKAAQKMLSETIPREAKKEGAPFKWLL